MSLVVLELEGLVGNDTLTVVARKRLSWELDKYRLNATVLEERQSYLDDGLIPTVRCPEDSTLPESLI